MQASHMTRRALIAHSAAGLCAAGLPSRALALDAKGDGTWATLAPLPVPQCEAATAVVNDEFWMLGGWGDLSSPYQLVQIYNPRTNSWRTGVPLPEASHHTGVAVVGDKLFVVGGFLNPFGQREPIDHVFAFDLKTQSWSKRAPLPSPRGGLIVAAIGGLVYAAGGERRRAANAPPPPPGAHPAYEPVADMAVYDPATDRWSVLAPMQVARDHAYGGVAAGKLLVVGGRDRPKYDITTLEEFDPATKAWTTRAPMPTGRSGGAGAVVGARLFTFGGEGNKANADGIYDEVESYDAATDAWSRHPALKQGRHSISVAAVGTKIYIAGGVPRAGGNGALTLLEGYEPA